MKKLIANFHKKDVRPPSRITNETVAEHREQILAGGRRFKYPIQYARHKLVINALIISISAIIILAVVGWWQLYPAQNSSEFIYRVTTVLPLPVASVDGQPVLYSDYLMKYRSDIHYLEQKEQVSLKSDDGKRQSDYHKRQAMEDVIADAYAMKLAKGLNMAVSDAEVEAFLKMQRQSDNGDVSEQTYNASILDILGWTPDEYRHAIKNKLLRQKVAYEVDKSALRQSEAVAAQLQAGNSNLGNIVEQVNATGGSKTTYGASGWVPKTNQDGGLSLAASSLQKLQISSVVKVTTNGEYFYYFVRLLDVNDAQISYDYIQIPLNEFTKQLSDLGKAGKVTEYISISKEDAL
jgi:hypothetical protein